MLTPTRAGVQDPDPLSFGWRFFTSLMGAGSPSESTAPWRREPQKWHLPGIHQLGCGWDLIPPPQFPSHACCILPILSLSWCQLLREGTGPPRPWVDAEMKGSAPLHLPQILLCMCRLDLLIWEGQIYLVFVCWVYHAFLGVDFPFFQVRKAGEGGRWDCTFFTLL